MIDITVGPPNEHGYLAIVSCSFEGQVGVIGYDGVTYVRDLTLQTCSRLFATRSIFQPLLGPRPALGCAAGAHANPQLDSPILGLNVRYNHENDPARRKVWRWMLAS